MAEGIRIRHHSARSGLLPVPLLHKPFPPRPARPICPTCRRVSGQELRHPVKTLHLMLDGEGCVIVSTGVWAEMQGTVNCGGFMVANKVLHPPTQVMRPALVSARVSGIDPN